MEDDGESYASADIGMDEVEPDHDPVVVKRVVDALMRLPVLGGYYGERVGRSFIERVAEVALDAAKPRK